MFVIRLNYVRPMAAVDAQLAAHREYLDAQYAEGRFLASGAIVPRTGGIILAVGDRAAVEATVATDPFITSGVATAEVTEFTASKVDRRLADLKEG